MARQAARRTVWRTDRGGRGDRTCERAPPGSSSNVDAVSSSKTNRVVDRVRPLLGTLRQTNPAAAKASATRSAGSVKEIAQLSLTYVKQETKVPLNGLGRFLGYGLAGAVFLGTGAVLLTLGVLRGLQTALSYERVALSGERSVSERGPLSGSWTWLPYVITAFVALLLIGLIVLSWLRDTKKTTR